MRGILKRFYFSGGVVQQIMDYFRTRVLGLSGIIEATICAEGTLNATNNANLLQQATFVMAASGYKSGVIYPQVPNSNSNGDLTFTRSSTATRVNSAGQIESIASGVPSLDYSQGTCPTFLFEPQRRNLLKYSQDYSQSSAWGVTDTTVNSASITAPDNSLTGNLITETLGVSSGLFQNITSSIANLPITVYFKYGTQDWIRILVSDSAVTTNNVRQWVNLQTGALGTSQANGTGTAISDAAISVVNGWYKITFKASFTGASGYTLQTMSAAANGSTSRGSAGNTRYEWGKMIEDNGSGSAVSYPTSYIPTTGATATRTVSSFTRNNVYTNGLISASGGTWFVELKNNLSIKGDISSSIYGLYIGDSSSAPSNAISIQNDNTTNRIKIATISSGTPTNRYTTSAASFKLAIVFNGSTLSVFENGVKQVNGIAFTPTISGYENLCDVNTDVSKLIRSMALWNTPLSDAQCIALTTP